MSPPKLREYVKLDEKYSSQELQAVRSKMPDLRDMQQRVINASNLKVQLFGLYASTVITPEKIVLIIPGNPGQGLFYVRYIQHLHKALEGRCDVFVVTLPGFESKAIHGFSRRFSLQNHIDMVTELATELQFEAGDKNKNPGVVPVSMIGHSIGAYIALYASKNLLNRKNYRVDSLIALFPFFRVDHQQIRQLVIKFVCNNLRFVAAIFIQILSFLPRFFVCWIFRALKFRQETHNMEAMLLLMRKHVALNALYMGMTEFKQLNGPTNWDLLEEFQDRLAVVAAPNDAWFSKQQYEEIQRKLPNVPVYWEPRQCHAFVVSESMCVECAHRTAEIYSRLTSL